MPTSNRLKLVAALLGTTFLVSPALAQNTVTVTATITSNNSVAVTGTGDFNSTSTINAATINNRIGVSGFGASTVAGVNQNVSGTPLAPGATLPGNSVVLGAITISATNSGVVNADVASGTNNFAGSASIANGIGNLIGVTAVGASTSASVSQSINVGNIVPATNPITFGNNQVTGSATLEATNTGSALSQGTFNAPTNNALISGGIGNSIVVGAGGAAATASVSQAIANSIVDISTNQNSVSVGTISATNNSAAGTSNVMATGNFTPTGSGAIAAEIVGGTGNAIVASAAGASAGAAISQSISNSTITSGASAQNLINYGSIGSSNSGQIEAVGTFRGPGGPSTAALIGGGTANTIGVQGIGASANASVTQNVLSGGSAGVTNFVDGGTITATNTGDIIATGNFTAASGGPGGTARISGGLSNSILVSAAGASAGAGVTQSMIAGLVTTGNNTVNYGSISATNGNGASVIATGNFNPIGAVAAQINGGLNNTIGVTAIGASANASVTQSLSSASSNGGTNSVEGGNIEATNRVQVQGIAFFVPSGAGNNSGALILDGVGNSIAVSSVGAAAGAGVTQSLNGSTGNGTNRVNLDSGTTITATNQQLLAGGGGPFTVSAQGTFSSTGTAAVADIQSGVGGRIAVAAVGSSASASITQSMNGNNGAYTNTVFSSGAVQPALSSNNYNAVQSEGTFNGAVTIGSTTNSVTVGNSITAGAVGASASASITQMTVGSIGTGTNSIQVSSIGSTNQAAGAVSSTGTFAGPVSIGATTPGTGVSIGNTIGVQAIGASSGATITAQHAFP